PTNSLHARLLAAVADPTVGTLVAVVCSDWGVEAGEAVISSSLTHEDIIHDSAAASAGRPAATLWAATTSVSARHDAAERSEITE
ncbi:hypothetical protein ABE50_00625, partial [Bacillus wiedmannii]|nr:hypothetical protein [Bacillus wiedmannii]